jgi:hypothetical protein
MKRIVHILLIGAVVAVAAVASLAVASPAKAQFVYDRYSHGDADVSCNIDKNGYGQIFRRTITIGAPVMLSPRGTQQVSYQPYLYRWDGSKWVQTVVGPAVFGLSGTSALADHAGFTINLPGQYWQVAILYKWYWYGAVEASQFVWAGTHTQRITQYSDGMTTFGFGTADAYCLMP